MKTIAVATDFSVTGTGAVNYAAAFAVATGSSLALLHVVSVPVAFSEVPDVTYNISEMVSDAEDSMNRLKEEIKTLTGNKIRISSEVKEGDVVTEIEHFCEEIHPVLLVMGAESGNPLERLFMGTHTFSAVKRSKVPVLVIPQNKVYSPVRRIGFACDFYDVKESAPVEVIKSWIKELKAGLHILHVNELKTEDYNLQVRAGSEWMHAVLNELHPDYHYIRQPDVDEAVIENVIKNKLDLLIVIARKHKGAEKIFHRSHTKQILLKTPVPVMIFPEED